MEKQITVITGSEEAESRMFLALDKILSANVDIEFKIIPKGCTSSELEQYIHEDMAGVFLIGSSRAATLGSYIAAFTSRDIVAVPLSDVKDDLTLFSKTPPLGGSFTITPINDVESAALLALKCLNLKAARALA